LAEPYLGVLMFYFYFHFFFALLYFPWAGFLYWRCFTWERIILKKIKNETIPLDGFGFINWIFL
jgi:hypothetical protein